MSDFKMILFDLDGTLIDSSEGITKAVQYTLKHYNIVENNLEPLKAFIGPPLDLSFMKYYNFSKEQAVEAISVYREYYKPIGIFECKLYPNVKESIIKLKQMGYKIGLASSKPEAFCKKILDYHGILELFDDVAGATEDGRIDTKEKVLQLVLDKFSDIKKEDICLIGDTIFDVEGANLKGISSIGVSFGFGDTDEMLSAGALCICDDLIQLPEILKEL